MVSWSATEVALLRNLIGVQNLDYAGAAAYLPKFSVDAIRSKWCRLQKKAEREGRSEARPKPNVVDTVSGDVRSIDVKRTKISTTDEFLREYAVDTKEWTLSTIVFNQWEMGAVIDGEVVVTPLFQAKGVFKRNKLVSAAYAEIQSMLTDAAAKFPPAPIYVYPARFRRPCALEISIPDQHVNKYAESDETGNDYNIEIAVKLFLNAVHYHLDKASTFDIEQIVVPFGNDILHTDNSAGTTTKGTQMDMDVRHKNAFRRCRRMLVEALASCAQLAPVVTFPVPGNHDRDCTYYLGDSIEAWFRDDPNVSVTNHATSRKVWEYGQTLLMFIHGDQKLARGDLPLLLAREHHEAWGRTKYHEIHTGHTHQVHLLEKMGARVRVLPSLCATDAYHAQAGFTGNLRVSESYIWDKETGLTALHVFTPSENDLKAEKL